MHIQMDPMDIEENAQKVSKSLESYMRKLIERYKNNPVLWDPKHAKYKNQDARSEALDELLVVTQDYYPEANIDFIKTKIASIRGAFRREHKKVTESKEKADGTNNDIYVPTLWYYNLLLFLVGENVEELKCDAENSRHVSGWSKHNTVALIQLLKQFPILYSLDPPPAGTKLKRIKAYEKITNALIAAVGQKFEVYEVRNKINMLKQQFRKAYKYRGHKAKFWCYDLLLFLKDAHGRNLKKANTCKEELQSNNTIDENIILRFESEDKKEEEIFDNHTDDLFDTIGKNVALKLRDMKDDQRIYADRLINEIMYNGLMDRLTVESRLSLG